MNPDFVQVLRAAFATIREPRLAAQRIITLDLERRQCWEILGLIAILSAILAFATLWIGARLSGAAPLPITSGPLILAFVQLVVLAIMALAIHFVGRRAGGDGELNHAILLVSWMQFVLICLQVVQILAMLLFPVLALLLGLFGFVLIFVLLTIFTSELHGFTSISGVFFSVLFVMLILATFVRFIFSLFGIDIVGVL